MIQKWPLWLVLWALVTLGWMCLLTLFSFGPERDSSSQLDLTELIGVPLPPSVSFITGFEGFPAYSFGPDANVGRLTRSFIPDPFYRDFSISVTARPSSRSGGVLFAVTDALQRTVQMGVSLAPVEDGSQSVVLYYTEPGATSTQEAASFKMGDLTGRWARFTLAVQGEEVRLYMDCEEHHRVSFRRSPDPLTFQPSSGIFIGNAGGTRLQRFVVSVGLLNAFNALQCALVRLLRMIWAKAKHSDCTLIRVLWSFVDVFNIRSFWSESLDALVLKELLHDTPCNASLSQERFSLNSASVFI